MTPKLKAVWAWLKARFSWKGGVCGLLLGVIVTLALTQQGSTPTPLVPPAKPDPVPAPVPAPVPPPPTPMPPSPLPSPTWHIHTSPGTINASKQ